MARRCCAIFAICLLASGIVPIFCASASENVAYSYDERGRLVKVSRSGTVNNGVKACYTYDKADNRSNVTAVMSGDCGQGGGGGGDTVSFAINDVAVTEGGNLVFTVSKAGTASQSYTVNFATANGTASSTSDYTANSGTLTFAIADPSKTVTVATTNDTSVENAETVVVNLSGASGGATISDSQGVGTINDNDTAPPATFSIADVSDEEGQTVLFVVTRSGTTATAVGVSFATANNTALAGSDYNAASGTLSFAANETSKTISVFHRPDTSAESLETYFVNLTNPTGGATISDAQAVGTIIDVPPPEQCFNEGGIPIPCDELMAPPPSETSGEEE